MATGVIRGAGLVLVVAAASASMPAAAQSPAVPVGFAGYAGGGIAVAPVYEGAPRMSVQFAPMADATWNDQIFLNDENGLGLWALKAGGFRMGPSVYYSEGRNNNGRVHGLGKISAAPVLKIAGAYRTDVGEFTVDAGRTVGGDNGFVVNADYNARFALSDALTIEGNVGATWANRRYLRAYFGVNQDQALGSGLPVTTAHA